MEKNKSKIILVFFIILSLVSTFLLSFFFSTNSRQPKTDTKAADARESPPAVKRFGLIISSSNPVPSSKPTPYPTIKLVKTPAGNPRTMLQITVTNNSFSPAKAAGKLGQIITLVFFAEDKAYRITLPELNLYKDIPQGGRDFLEFQAVSTGQFTYTCANGCSAFSKGILTVTE